MEDRNDMPITENDEIRIQIIGYKSQGESIVVTIGNQEYGYNKFAGIIDCFKVGRNFITKKILKENNIKKLDFICWTHPDWDHTYGLSELESYIGENTRFALPQGTTDRQLEEILNEKQKVTKYTKEYGKIFSMIKKIKKCNIVHANHSSTLYTFRMLCCEKSFKFHMCSFAPISSIVTELSNQGIIKLYQHVKGDEDFSVEDLMNKKNNLYSMGIRITLTDEQSKETLAFCMCGDLDNMTIEAMDGSKAKGYMGNNTIFKIPHHSSKNANLIISKGYISRAEYAVTTGYKMGRNDLPDKEVLKQYKRIIRPTGKVIRTDYIKEDTYGIAEFRYNIYKLILSEFKPIKAAGEY